MVFKKPILPNIKSAPPRVSEFLQTSFVHLKPELVYLKKSKD